MLNYSKWVYLLLSDLFIDSVLILYVIDIVLENKLSKPDYSTFFSGNDYLIIKFSYFDNLQFTFSL